MNKARKQKVQNSCIPGSKIGKQAVVEFFALKVIKLLKILAIEDESSNQELLRKVVNHLFIKHYKKPIACNNRKGVCVSSCVYSFSKILKLKI